MSSQMSETNSICPDGFAERLAKGRFSTATRVMDLDFPGGLYVPATASSFLEEDRVACSGS